jgi:poly(3-hydroxybutyrate) depolymerase
MSQRTACDAADVFASASSYAGGTPTAFGVGTPCTPSRPIAVAMFAGQFDFTYPALASNAQDWRTIDGCGAGVHSTDQYGATDTYACAAGTHVVARVVNLTSHNWPSGAMGEDQRERLWAFFTANPRA